MMAGSRKLALLTVVLQLALATAGTDGYAGTKDHCGDSSQGLTPVDCTSQGDSNSACVYGNHCQCSAGFLCETSMESGECKPGDVCIVLFGFDDDIHHSEDSGGTNCPDGWTVIGATCYSEARVTAQYVSSGCDAGNCNTVYDMCAQEEAVVTTKDELHAWIANGGDRPRTYGITTTTSGSNHWLTKKHG